MDRYINASIERFGECLVYYQQYRVSVSHLSKNEVEKLITTTQDKIREADATAFGSPENWWSVIIEQMQQGLL